MHPFVRRLVPPALVLGGMAVVLRAGSLAEWSAARQSRILWLLLAAAFLLAWRLRSARAARAAVGLAALDALIGSGAASAAAAAALALTRIAVPLDLAAVAWIREASLGSRRGVLLFALLAVEAAALGPWTVAGLDIAGRTVPTSLPWLEGAAVGLGLALLALRLHRRPTPLAAGWIGVLVGVSLALRDAGRPRLWLVAAALVLLVALVERAFGFAFEDALTGLPGRRAFDQRLRELSGAFAVAMVDVDHFKKVNDRNGHAVGDQVLRWVAAHLRAAEGGTAFRYGGEEFAVVFPGTTAKEARAAADGLRGRIADDRFALREAGRPERKPKRRAARPKPAARTLRVTVSIGVAARTERSRTPASVVKAADRALYRAKRAGRNRVAATYR